MNALKVVLIVVALAIFGCAGVGVQRTCIKDALHSHWVEREDLKNLHAEPRLNDTCEEVTDVSEADYIHVNKDERFTYFRCEVIDALEDDEYALLLDSNTLRFRSQIRSCLRR